MQDNKDYILNIRVSKETYEKLKHKAKENSESLSNLVRKTLDDSWEIFGDLKNEIFGETKKERVMYYQKVIIGSAEFCGKCGKALVRGDSVLLGETKAGQKKFFCMDCFNAS